MAVIEFIPYLVLEHISKTEEQYKVQELFLQMIYWRLSLDHVLDIAKNMQIQGFTAEDLFDNL